MSTHSRKARRSFQTPLDLVRSVSSVPAKDTGKRTVQIEEPREVQAIENVYEFFTKQRPVAWQYVYRTTFRSLLTAAELQTTRKLPIVSVDQGQVLVINHFSAYLDYIRDPNNADESFLRETATGNQFGKALKFNLVSETGSLYEVHQEDTSSSFGFFGSDIQGFTELNQNVLNNGDSSTSLFVFEPDELFAEYSIGLTEPQFLASLPNAGAFMLSYASVITFEVRGHFLNKMDGELLKSLLQSN